MTAIAATLATPADVIARLGMRPHPEGGHYVQTFRDSAGHDGRAASTAIYYLLQAWERSHWHRVDAVEIWHYYGGAALALDLSADGITRTRQILGVDLAAGERPQSVVPTGVWQSAQSLGAWTLVGCTVAPGFRFEGFEMAPTGWEPGKPGA